MHPHDMTDAIGPRLAQLREIARLSQAKVAAAGGWSVATVRAWEAGRRVPTPANLSALSQALGCRPIDLRVAARMPFEGTTVALDAMEAAAGDEPLTDADLDTVERWTTDWLADPQPDVPVLTRSAHALLAKIRHWRSGDADELAVLAIWWQTNEQRAWFVEHMGVDPYPDKRAFVEKILFRMVRDLRRRRDAVAISSASVRM